MLGLLDKEKNRKRIKRLNLFILFDSPRIKR
ncbi:Hypothetical protein Minf_2166 [Methylacidiphilum infernorum V4]|uniref:Uncharacterized protein n=1 Tax=Methylacidiphilum infernorum (isolate V4) TaxID=481448 RepID=B3DZN5_METI4|nr:Hypothetical protein Minf_2166 [Methylacidiphilum infernorum V4]